MTRLIFATVLYFSLFSTSAFFAHKHEYFDCKNTTGDKDINIKIKFTFIERRFGNVDKKVEPKVFVDGKRINLRKYRILNPFYKKGELQIVIIERRNNPKSYVFLNVKYDDSLGLFTGSLEFEQKEDLDAECEKVSSF